MGWNSYDDAAERGPRQLLTKLILLCFFCIILIGGLSFATGWIGNAANVVKKEFSAEAMLKKYEWFKNASAELDNKKANIKVYAKRVQDLNNDYEGVKRNEWARTDREQLNQWRSELSGVTASYNSLSAEYNAQMAKINWAFANVGQLPKGATVALNREYKSYMEE